MALEEWMVPRMYSSIWSSLTTAPGEAEGKSRWYCGEELHGWSPGGCAARTSDTAVARDNASDHLPQEMLRCAPGQTSEGY